MHPQLTFDIWDYLFRVHVPIAGLEQDKVRDFQYLSTDFSTIFRPFMYRHVNLLSWRRGISFLSTVIEACNRPLAESTRTLHISFDLGTEPTENKAIDVETFWNLWQQALPRLTNLSSLCICFSPTDTHFLRRVYDKGDLRHSLPPTVLRLHLKPLPDEYYGLEDFLIDGPWDSTEWGLTISLIPHIKQLIVTTPTYIIWPPTEKMCRIARDAWTAQLRRRNRGSQLKEIVIESAFGDEAERHRNWEKKNQRIGSILTGGLDYSGAAWAWHKTSHGTWVDTCGTQYVSNREEYFFGLEGAAYYETWYHIDAALWAQQWLEHMRRDISQGAFFPTKYLE
ncbi:hypothetical protein B0H15DRAFT_855861 [Mycena belliarum]|uniref:Uncharacterized protein n=1 Tax=Mycena belliarum TaxID=1033014 RepID=A0AAD6TZD2_9AGAR|nr:hypothetical protein B0H15DRAFT_855861 [Mycena belliae]